MSKKSIKKFAKELNAMSLPLRTNVLNSLFKYGIICEEHFNELKKECNIK